MFKRLLVKYKLQKSVNKLIVFFCLFILSGCGGGMGAEGVADVSSSDSGGVSTGIFIDLSWTPPMSNAEGLELTDLSGYIVHYRNNDDGQAFSTDVGNITSNTIHLPAPGTWCFNVTAYNASGADSDLSDSVCKQFI